MGFNRTAPPERLPPGHRHALPDPQRVAPERVRREIQAVAESPVITAVLEVSDAVLLVVNAARQIVAFNSRVPDVERPEDLLGLRTGDALGCVHARGKGGCGTAAACATCGALGAILGCQERGASVESECLIRSARSAGAALEFNVRATPITIELIPFTIVALRDISSEKRREVLEQVFIHDLLNTVAGLRGWAQRLRRGGADVARATERIDLLTHRIEREIVDHRALLLAETGALVPDRALVPVADLLQEVAAVFSGHPVARDRTLRVAPVPPELGLFTDSSLLARVLVNMVHNAFEAIPAGGVVRLACEVDAGAVRLSVHNDGVIAPEVRPRIFHRSFSTKALRGRGLGTYAMKLFGERHLGGEVSFASDARSGTVFSIRLPQ